MSRAKNGKGPLSRTTQVLVSLIITVILGAVYFYFSLPAINLKSGEFYVFAVLLCAVFIVVSLLLSGANLRTGDVRSFLNLAKRRCLPAIVLVLLLLAVAVVGYIVSAPILSLVSEEQSPMIPVMML